MNVKDRRQISNSFDTVSYPRMNANSCSDTFTSVVMFNVKHEHVPDYLTDLFVSSNSVYDHHTRSCINLHITCP